MNTVMRSAPCIFSARRESPAGILSLCFLAGLLACFIPVGAGSCRDGDGDGDGDAKVAAKDGGKKKHKGKPNRLAKEKSPYLQQHAYNPVDWYPWGEEAFAKARMGNRQVRPQEVSRHRARAQCACSH